MRREADWRKALPADRSSRVLLGLGAFGLLLILPMLWIWLLYGSSLGASGVWAAALALSGLAGGLGFAMIKMLDSR